MFTANLVLHDQAAADVTSTQIFQSGSEVRRLVSGTTAEPTMMVINHQVVGKENPVDRHLVQLTKIQFGTVSGREYKTTVNFTVSTPRITGGDANTNGLTTLVGYLQNFLNDSDVAQAQTNLTRLVAGES